MPAATTAATAATTATAAGERAHLCGGGVAAAAAATAVAIATAAGELAHLCGGGGGGGVVAEIHFYRYIHIHRLTSTYRCTDMQIYIYR